MKEAWKNITPAERSHQKCEQKQQKQKREKWTSRNGHEGSSTIYGNHV
jgi:hypothetical protein